VRRKTGHIEDLRRIRSKQQPGPGTLQFEYQATLESDQRCTVSLGM
jgi:hypothetical protein